MAKCVGCGKDASRLYNSACGECVVDGLIRRDAFIRSQEKKDQIAKEAYQSDLEDKALRAFDDAMGPIRNMAAVFMAGDENCIHLQTGELIQTFMEKAEARFARVLREGSPGRQEAQD